MNEPKLMYGLSIPEPPEKDGLEIKDKEPFFVADSTTSEKIYALQKAIEKLEEKIDIVMEDLGMK